MTRLGDVITALSFQIPWAQDGPPPVGYPFCFLRNVIILFMSISGRTAQMQWTGQQLWCLVQALPNERRTALLRAAQQGFVIFQGGEFWPALDIHCGSWCLEWDQEAYVQWWADCHETHRTVLAQLGDWLLPDLARTIEAYRAVPVVVRPAVNMCQQTVFLNLKKRDTTLCREVPDFVVRSFHHEAPAIRSEIPLDFGDLALFELHVLVAHGNQPYTFYAPEDQPLDDLFLWHHEPMMVSNDRWSLAPFSRVAHYVYRCAHWWYESARQVKTTDFSVPQHLRTEGQPLVSVQPFVLHVKPSPRLDPQARLHIWAKGVLR